MNEIVVQDCDRVAEYVKGELEQLKPKFRRVIVAILVDNKRFTKIAEEEEVTLLTVHRRYKKGLSIISELLQRKVALDPEFARAYENATQELRKGV